MKTQWLYKTNHYHFIIMKTTFRHFIKSNSNKLTQVFVFLSVTSFHHYCWHLDYTPLQLQYAVINTITPFCMYNVRISFLTHNSSVIKKHYYHSVIEWTNEINITSKTEKNKNSQPKWSTWTNLIQPHLVSDSWQ